MRLRGIAAACALVLAGCQQSAGEGTAPDTKPEGFTGIAPGETISFGGTEPFWNGEIAGRELTYMTPEDPDGRIIRVERFIGQGGLGFSGTLDGAPFDMAVTAGECTDGMSDRVYPFTVTLQIGERQMFGCAYTDRQPFSEGEAP